MSESGQTPATPDFAVTAGDSDRLAAYAGRLSLQARAILAGTAERWDAVTVAALQRGGLLDEATNELTADGRKVVALLASESSGEANDE